MKTEISRDSHQPEKHYSGVYQQQGRMFTDSDINEQADITRQRLDTALNDVITSGTPREGGLGITPDAKIQPGRIYIDGVPAQLADHAAPVALDAQPDFPSFPAISKNPYLLYADVWQRAVSALEDKRLLDDGLHGADTCTRRQTMLQIKWCPEHINPQTVAENPPVGDALLSLLMRSGSSAGDPCDPCADVVNIATITGNYLMRVEVHSVSYIDDFPSHGINSFVLKWSAENGAEQYCVGEEPESYRQRKRVYEFFNETSEKHLGVHLATAADFPVRGELHEAFPSSPPSVYSHVRRWDGYCDIDVSAGVLQAGSEHGVALSSTSAAGNIGHVELSTSLSISLTAMNLQLQLAGRQLVAGDYWLGEVREDAIDVNTLLPNDALPEGIRHHYLTLARVDAGLVTTVSNGDCKRHGFPPLTDIHATDVCYDNTTCNFPDANNVQDALDHLCRQKGLKYHNKHLHGWGIVCGLQLECAPDNAPDGRRHIMIQQGAAIDCEGSDIILEHARKYPVIELAGQLPEIAAILEQKGDADVCLVMESGQDGKPEFILEHYDAKDVKWQDMLSGTLLMDFYEDCIKAPLDDIRNFFKAEQAIAGDMFSVADERIISLLNLLIQLQDRDNGRYVFISLKEDKILRDIYAFVKAILKSRTYCAMYDGLAGIPEYPFPETEFSTIFGPVSKWRRHDRLRIHPHEVWGYTLGGEDSNIHVFDLQKEALVAEIAHPGGQECEVQDVAFSADGKRIYAIALLDGKTIMAEGLMDGYQIKWADSKIICDLQLITLANHASEPFSIYAIARGKGLFQIDMTASPLVPKPVEECYAAGHLLIPQKGVFGQSMAYITVGKPTSPDGTYNEVRAIDLQQSAAGKTIHFPLENDGEGEDDIAVVLDAEKQAAHLYIVSGLSSQTGVAGGAAQKQLLHFNAVSPEKPGKPLQLENTEIRLQSLQSQAQLLISFADSHRLARLDVRRNKIVLEHHPVQIAPSSLAVAATADIEQAYVLNNMSNTINPIPAKANTVIDIEELAKYRDGVLAAFSALSTGLVQYLKDCFCHHLLVKCPQCSDEDRIYLGNISIRSGQVYKVCNFSKRKYVKSFPTVSYWMSILPVARLLDRAVEVLCCSVVPDLFSKIVGGKTALVGRQNYARKLSGYAQMMHKANIRGALNRQGEQLRIVGGMARHAIANGLGESLLEQPGSLGKANLSGLQVDAARTQLQKRGIIVTGIKPYAATSGLKNISSFIDAPTYLKPGDQVELYQKDGLVTFYSVPASAPENVSSKSGADTGFVALDEQGAALEKRLADLQATSQVLESSLGLPFTHK